jgi:DNA-binding CsgD family transcriptional regulator
MVVLVEGEPGVGKSSLLGAFRDSHPDVTTWTWTGDDAETRLAFGMLGQLVHAHGPWTDPYSAGAALLDRMDEIAPGDTVLLALDDIHLADRASLLSLNFAIRRVRHDPILVLASSRSAHVADLPSSIVRKAADQGGHVTLGGLRASDVRALGEAMGVTGLSRRAAERLYSLTGGNPLHLKALLREVPQAELERWERPLPAPRSFSDLTLAELASTSAPARKLASAASVLGDRCELADLIAVAGLDEPTALSAIDELSRARLLHLPPGSSAVGFEHPLVRAAVYADLGPAARSHLHRAAAARRDGWPALQHRIAAAHGADPVLADDLEDEANRARSSGNLMAAAEAMLAAHRRTPAGADADRRILSGVVLFTAAGDARSALAYADSVAQLPPTGPRLATQARLAWLTGRFDEAVALGRDAWAHGDLDPFERDQVAAMLAQIETLRDHVDEGVSWAKRALADGRLAQTAASHTRMQLTLALSTSGRISEARTLLADLPADPEEVDVARHPELAMRGFLATFAGPQREAQRDLTVASSMIHGDLQPFRLEAAAALSRSQFWSGQWDRSHAVVVQRLALAEDIEQTWMLGYLHAECAAVPSARGDWSTAEQYVSTALDLARSASDLASSAYAEDAAALLAVARGRPDEVAAATERIRRTAPSSPQHNLGIFWWPVYLVVALVELGRLDEAEAELATLEGQVWPTGGRVRAGRLRAAGQLAAARGDTASARRCLTAALTIPEAEVDALERALAHEAYGRFLRRRGERRAAVEHLREGRTLFAALGAAPFAARCEPELAACGINDRNTPAREDPLTPQERAVAALVCVGHTNRQVAQELVVSVKTVGYHLANVYAKLGVHSRTQLAVAMRAHEVAPDVQPRR